ncbi:hypothetical protein M422DRAFT_36185, partial [Sphaerobolus stellatus SS14]
MSTHSRVSSVGHTGPVILLGAPQSDTASTSDPSESSGSHTTRSRTLRHHSRSRSRSRSPYNPGNGHQHDVRVVKYVLPQPAPGTDCYAISPVPTSYDDALRDAIAVLGFYRPQMTMDNTILRLREYLNTDVWAWADIAPNHWNEIVTPNLEIGLFLKERLPILIESEFLHGNVILTYGHSHLGATKWTEVPPHKKPYMCRPRSYEEANALALKCFAHHWRLFGDALKELHDKKKKRFVYCCFWCRAGETKVSTEAWLAMPEEAYQNADIWRAHVAAPGAILGVMLQ